MKFDFDKMVDRHGTHCMEYDCTDEMNAPYGLAPIPKNLIALEVADMDFQCAPCIKDALQKVVDHNLYGYCTLHPSMDTNYYKAIVDWSWRHYSWKIEQNEIFYAPGTLHAITYALKAFTQEGDGILLTPPVYTPFYRTVRDAGRRVVKSSLLNSEGYYTVNWSDFEAKAADPSVRAFLLCSPHNPVGRVWTEEELTRMYDICTRNDVVVIADEIHCDLIRRENKFIPISKIAGGKNVVTCTGANKTFNLAGLQVSHIVCQDPDMKKKLEDVIGWVAMTPFAIAAASAAYTEGDEWLEQLLDYLDANIDAAISFLHEHMPKVKVWRPEGTYLLWMDFSAYGLSDDEIFDRWYHKAGVTIEQGREFDEGGSPGFVRIVTSTQRARLLEALNRVAKQFE